MNKSALDFLTQTLGFDGATALSRAADKEPSLGELLVPRTAYAWVQATQSFSGRVPGSESTVEFKKSEVGFSGFLVLDGNKHEFDAASPEYMAALLSVAVGIESTSTEPRDVTLVKLGKSIDTLVGVQQNRIFKQSPVPAGYTINHEELPDGLKVHAYDKAGNRVGTAWFKHHEGSLKPVIVGVEDEHQRRGLATSLYNHAKNVTGKNIVQGDVQTDEGQAFRNSLGSVRKVELPGQTAKPLDQQGPQAPEAPKKQPRMKIAAFGKTPKGPPKLPALKVEKSEMTRQCDVCEQNHFVGNQFKGCLCTRDLSKSIKTIVYNDGVVLEFAPGVTKEEFDLLHGMLK
jgi:hypothetical protein